MPLTIATWVGLRAAVLLAKKKIIPCDNPPVTLENFLRSIKKGSKKFRDVIDRPVYRSRSVSEISVANSFARITNTALPSDLILKNYFSGWNCTFLDNDFREFIFKCRNNLLKTADRLSHILPNVSENCMFCKGLIPGTQNRETFLHLFRECTVTSAILLRLNIRCNLQSAQMKLSGSKIVISFFLFVLSPCGFFC